MSIPKDVTNADTIKLSGYLDKIIDEISRIKIEHKDILKMNEAREIWMRIQTYLIPFFKKAGMRLHNIRNEFIPDRPDIKVTFDVCFEIYVSKDEQLLMNGKSPEILGEFLKDKIMKSMDEARNES